MSVIKPGVVTQTCNLSTQKVGWEDSRVQGNPGLRGLVSKTKQKQNKPIIPIYCFIRSHAWGASFVCPSL